MILRCTLTVGLPVSALGLMLAATLTAAADLPARFFPIAAALPLLLGTYAAAVCAARRKRHHGWQTGTGAGLLLAGIWQLAACLLLQRLTLPLILPLAAAVGAAGGVRGVNLPQPRLRRRRHGLIARRERRMLRRTARTGRHRRGAPPC